MKSEKAASVPEENTIDVTELPEGWKNIKICEFATTKAGGTPSTSRRDYWDGEIPWINSGALKDSEVNKASSFITELGLVSSSTKLLPKNTVLIALTGATTGRVGLLTIEAAANQSVVGIIENPSFNSKYLFYFLLYSRDKILNLAIGSAQPHINKNVVDNFTVPLPPIAEQQRIVARVENLLTHISAARDKLNRVPLIMKKFRQGLLAAACEGRLTEGWREKNPDIETSSQFLERFFNGKKEPIKNLIFNDAELPDIPESWIWIEFGKIICELKNGVYLVGPNFEPPGNPILRISSVRPGKVNLDDIKYLLNSDEYLKEYHLKNKDLLFTRYNGSLELVGICGMVREIHNRIFLYPDKLIRARFDPDVALPEYAELYFQSFSARTNIYSVIKSSAGQKGVSGQDIKIQPFPLPPLVEQHEIVRRVDLLFERVGAFDQEVVAASLRCERLTQAVLGKAFRGELTTHDS